MHDEVIRTAYRIRARLLCTCGRHLWATRRNPEVGGKAAVFETCRRCGTERAQYDPLTVRQASGFGL